MLFMANHLGFGSSWGDAMLAQLKTDPELLKRLHESPAKPATKDELEKQLISFVYGNLPSDSTITRAQVEDRIKANEGA